MSAPVSSSIDPVSPEHDGWQPIRRRPDPAPSPTRGSGLQHVLVAADEEIGNAIASCLLVAGVEVSFVVRPDAATEYLEAALAAERAPDLLILAPSMFESSRWERVARCYARQLPVVVLAVPDAAEGRALSQVLQALHTVVSVASVFPEACDWSRLPVDPRCPACHGTSHLVMDPFRAGTQFCDECWDRARPADPDDDIGGGD